MNMNNILFRKQLLLNLANNEKLIITKHKQVGKKRGSI